MIERCSHPIYKAEDLENGCHIQRCSICDHIIKIPHWTEIDANKYLELITNKL